jgi:hypothetical protein
MRWAERLDARGGRTCGELRPCAQELLAPRPEFALHRAERACLQLVEALRVLAEALRRMKPPEPVARVIQGIRALPEAARGRGGEAPPGSFEGIEPAGRVRNRELGSRGRRRRAEVRDEVSDREIDLVADAGDERKRHAGNYARERLVVECPEVLE